MVVAIVHGFPSLSFFSSYVSLLYSLWYHAYKRSAGEACPLHIKKDLKVVPMHL